MKEIIAEIRNKIKLRDNGPAVDTMRKLGINYKTIHGLSIMEIKNIATAYQYNHELALKLWKWDNREFKILATFIENPSTVGLEQMLLWANEINNSELSEQLAINLAYNTPQPEAVCSLWFEQKKPYTKNAASLLLAWMAQKTPEILDSYFLQKLKQLPRFIDSNLYLAKSISFAIRAIGKRNLFLNKEAIELLESLKAYHDYNTKLIVEEALWELESDIIQDRLS